jgi:hypothetical protein
LAEVEAYTNDLGVMDGPFTETALLLDVQTSLLTGNADNAPYLVNADGDPTTNVTGDPGFINPYFNGAFGNLDITEFTTLSTAGAFDEGGNFIQVIYSPLSIIDPDSTTGELLDYHTAPGTTIGADGVPGQ